MYNPWPVSVGLDHPEGHVRADGSRQESCYLAGNKSVCAGVQGCRRKGAEVQHLARALLTCWLASVTNSLTQGSRWVMITWVVMEEEVEMEEKVVIKVMRMRVGVIKITKMATPHLLLHRLVQSQAEVLHLVGRGRAHLGTRRIRRIETQENQENRDPRESKEPG